MTTVPLPDLTALIDALLVVIVLTAAILIGVVVAFFVRHHKHRLSRHQSMLAHYSHLVLGH